jgi:hypothetical protein
MWKKVDHIVRMIGLDGDQTLLVLELMEGGDLLSYLRCAIKILGKSTDPSMSKIVEELMVK